MQLREFYEIDQNTGQWLEVHVLDIENQEIEIPLNFVEGWNEGFYSPIYDLETKEWKEGKPLEEILEVQKVSKIEELNLICRNEIEKGFEYNGYFFEFESHDQDNFTQTLALLSVDPTTTNVTWKTKNQGIVNLTREEFLQVCKKAETTKRNNIGKCWILKSEVEQATTIEEVNNITWQ